MSSEEADHVSPMCGNADIGQRDSGHLAVPSSKAVPGRSAGISRKRGRDEAVGKSLSAGCMRTSA
jgi:hypothetical protein